jgi:hypothetical protein
VYQVTRNGQPVYAQSAAIPAQEGDLTALDASVLKGRLAGGRSVQYRSVGGGNETRDEMWIWLAVGCVAVMLTELVALKLFKT